MMFRFVLSVVTLISFTGATAQNTNTKMDSVSYSLGVLMAQNLKQQGFDKVDAASLVKGFEDVVQGNALKISADEANQVVSTYMQAKQAKQYEGVIAAGQQFLAENAKRPGVVTLPSGLQYEILRAGDGAKPMPQDQVTVHYEGKLLNGTVFDSSVQRGQPATFGVTQVIQGWVEALQLMPQGAKWKLFIPYNLAYGERGAGPTIGPYSTLVFEVELLKIN
ncbi:MAG TPA: FKBP-type peptidyl-prolyl cis-trans isomerase [Saprospiraceae bacterium]|nr:FKBP-type peptidyl-prolyl cis-trans isomerase [Saprospiraceae bacterium]HMP15209.1 FKBP-type peptidyl-prolyl cis-trans isomerase [Saprospiraceae bacterium]